MAELDTLLPKRERLETVVSLIADCDREVRNFGQEIRRTGDAMHRALEMGIADVGKRYTALTQEHDELKTQMDTQRLTEQAIEAAYHYAYNIFFRLLNRMTIHSPRFPMPQRFTLLGNQFVSIVSSANAARTEAEDTNLYAMLLSFLR